MNILHTPEFDRAVDLVENTSSHVLITGRAGTGKSTLLTYIQLHTKKRMVVLAPTGIAALNVRGQTIHSFFGFTPETSLEQALRRARHLKKEERTMYRTLETIVIDEISMVRADLLDMVDHFLKTALGDSRPFAGKQMVWIGDFYQLPPVLKREEKETFHLVYKTPYFFSSVVIKELLWSAVPLFHVELAVTYRQDEAFFISLLNAMREGYLSMEQRNLLATRVQGKPPHERCIYLMSTNAQADEENAQRLASLAGEEKTYVGKKTGELEGYSFPAPHRLMLKVGARVMFLTNDTEGRWQNGTLGTVMELKGMLMVLLDTGISHEVKKHRWEVYETVLNEEHGELEQKSIGSFAQYPLKLAWAITIHKSQGQTFDEVYIDLGRGAFAEGQTYVAFSRCRTFGGLYLAKPLYPRDLKADRRIDIFFEILAKKKPTM